MKNLLLIIVFGILNFSVAKAQDNAPGKKAERIQALKIAFITQKLDLTTDEAQRFWPVYNRYESEIRQGMRDSRNDNDALSGEEKILNVKKRYRPEFIKAVGEPKTNRFYNAEREFRGVLLRQLKNRQGQRRDMNPRRQQ